MRPLIGITTEREHAHWVGMDAEVDLLPANYADMVAAAGGCPVLVPLRPGCEHELVEHLNGLLVSGGADISADCYGATAHPSMRDIRPDRDQAELAVLRAFIAARRPVLAICNPIAGRHVNRCRRAQWTSRRRATPDRGPVPAGRERVGHRPVSRTVRSQPGVALAC